MRKQTISGLFLQTFIAGWLVTVGFAVELPVETFFRTYEHNEALLSPDGIF